jgi:hypothetical protein
LVDNGSGDKGSASTVSDNQEYSLRNEESIEFDLSKSFNEKPVDCQNLCIRDLD